MRAGHSARHVTDVISRVVRERTGELFLTNSFQTLPCQQSSFSKLHARRWGRLLVSVRCALLLAGNEGIRGNVLIW